MKMAGEKKERKTIKSLSQEICILKEQVKEIEPLKKTVVDLVKIVENLKIDNNFIQVQGKSVRENLQEVTKCNECDKTFESKTKFKKHKLEIHQTKIKCNDCDKEFTKNCELEVHVINEHQSVQKFQCDLCDKTFVLKWRLRKHQMSHLDEERKKCHYFNNGKNCPFDEIGCMFAHEASKMCMFDKSCSNKLCSYQHSTSSNKNLESEKFKSKEDNENSYICEDLHSFEASTPKKSYECEDCENESEECVECIVKRVRGRHGGVTTASRTSTLGCSELESSSCSTSGCSGGARSSFS